MTRERERDEPLSVFSEWHRDEDVGMPGWYKYIDADYIGYIDPYRYPPHGYKPYIIMELVHVTDREKWESDTPVHQQWPLHDHKRETYASVDEKIDVPVYVMWHPSACDEFVVKGLGDGETKQLSDKHEFADFLDDRRDYMINKLNKRAESEEDQRQHTARLTEW